MSIRLIGALLVAALIVGLLLFGPAACNRIRSLGTQVKVGNAQQDALANSAADAVETQGAVNDRERSAEDLTRQNEKDIRNAEGSADPVNPVARDAGLRALCARRAYRDSERCRLFLAAPAGMEQGR